MSLMQCPVKVGPLLQLSLHLMSLYLLKAQPPRAGHAITEHNILVNTHYNNVICNKHLTPHSEHIPSSQLQPVYCIIL